MSLKCNNTLQHYKTLQFIKIRKNNELGFNIDIFFKNLNAQCIKFNYIYIGITNYFEYAKKI